MNPNEIKAELGRLAKEYHGVDADWWDQDKYELDPHSHALELKAFELIINYAIEQKVSMGTLNVELFLARNDEDNEEALDYGWNDDFCEFLLELDNTEKSKQYPETFLEIINYFLKAFWPDSFEPYCCT
jgi:hypothetical protein